MIKIMEPTENERDIERDPFAISTQRVSPKVVIKGQPQDNSFTKRSEEESSFTGTDTFAPTYNIFLQPNNINKSSAVQRSQFSLSFNKNDYTTTKMGQDNDTTDRPLEAQNEKQAQNWE